MDLNKKTKNNLSIDILKVALTDIYGHNAELTDGLILKTFEFIKGQNRTDYLKVFERLEKGYNLKPDVEMRDYYLKKGSNGSSYIACLLSRNKQERIKKEYDF